MSSKSPRLWTLADYQAFLQHADPIIRNWAVHCIEEQFPHQRAESFVSLLTDGDRHLQIAAASAIDDGGDSRYEPALLAVWPESKGPVRNWLTRALGRLRSPAILPDLIAVVEAVADTPLTRNEDEMIWRAPHAAAEALGHYPDEPARATLWRLIERYPADDRLTFAAVEGLLRFIRPDEVTRLIQRWAELKPATSKWWQILRALAGVANLEGLVMQLIDLPADDPDELLDYLDFWFLQDIPYSAGVVAMFDQAAGAAKAGLFAPLLAELERVLAERGDDVNAWLAAWQNGEHPSGYRGRMLYAHQLLAALAAHPPRRPQKYQAAVCLGLALLAQALVDQDDEAALRAAPNEMFRQATLLSILGSPRPNVLPDIIEQVTALGPGVAPHLVEILESDNVWAWLRVLPVTERLARTQPGAADAVAPAILDLIHLEQGDEVLEQARLALVAIGPGAVEAIGERLGQDDTYDIFAGSALTDISTPAAVETWLDYLASKPELDEFDIEMLGDLGHAAAIPFLRDNFAWRNDPLLCTALYKLAVVTQYAGPEFRHWRSVAGRDYRAYVRDREREQ
ncbi:MAG: hypothetical protein AB1801_06055 [Chloroflexota bacterium]